MDKVSKSIFFRICTIISILCILITIGGWIVNWIIKGPHTYLIDTTFIPGFIGFIMALIILIKDNFKLGIVLAILNFIMFFSLFIMMAIGYTLEYILN